MSTGSTIVYHPPICQGLCGDFCSANGPSENMGKGIQLGKPMESAAFKLTEMSRAPYTKISSLSRLESANQPSIHPHLHLRMWSLCISIDANTAFLYACLTKIRLQSNPYIWREREVYIEREREMLSYPWSVPMSIGTQLN